jgi:hypothetical protein
MARVFAVMVQSLSGSGAIAVQIWTERTNLSLLQNYRSGHWRSDRGTNYIEARNLSWCRILIESRCANPGAR